MLEPSFRRLSGRTGPGAGRPSKLYRRSEQEIRLHLPVRQYELAATLLMSAIDGRTGEPPIEALRETAREFGLRLGKSMQAEAGDGANQDQLIKLTRRILTEYGYEPLIEDGVIRFRNCPFEALTQRRSSPVCDMNWAMLDGFLKGSGAVRLKAISKREEPGCCVILRVRPAA